MNKLFTIFLLATCVFSCRKREVFPDLAKQIEGRYNVTGVTFYYPKTNTKISNYNPKDSIQVGLITVQKIDALSVKVRMLLSKRSGEVVYDYSFDSELSRDVVNKDKGWIKLDGLYSDGGYYREDEKLLTVGSQMSGPPTERGTVQAGMIAKR